jgi:hypothetical protein
LDSDIDKIISVSSTSKLGKIVKINMSYNQESQLIHSIKITGDFFIHPEEVIEKLEYGLCGIKLEKQYLKNKIQLILENSEFFGFEIDSLTDIILKTCDDRK